MSFAKKTIEGFDKLIRRNREMAGRIKSLERRMAVLDGISGGAVRNELAPLTAAGSPIGQLGEWLVAKILGEHPDYEGERIYQAAVQEPTAHGQWSDADKVVVLIGYPATGNGDQASDRPTFGEGEYVLVRWDGRDPVSNIDFYHAQRPAGTGGFWGIVTECNRTSHNIKVQKAEGTLPNLTVIDEEDDEITVYVGAYHHLCLGEPVWCWRNNAGIKPDHTAYLPVYGFCYTEPEEEDLCEDQDDGGGIDNICCEEEEE